MFKCAVMLCHVAW